MSIRKRVCVYCGLKPMWRNNICSDCQYDQLKAVGVGWVDPNKIKAAANAWAMMRMHGAL